MRAIQSGVWGTEETARAAGDLMRRRRGLVCGDGEGGWRARGRAVFFSAFFFSGPMRRRISSAWASWAVGGPREQQSVRGRGSSPRLSGEFCSTTIWSL